MEGGRERRQTVLEEEGKGQWRGGEEKERGDDMEEGQGEGERKDW